MKKIHLFLLVGLLAAGICGCSADTTVNKSEKIGEVSSSEISSEKKADNSSEKADDTDSSGEKEDKKDTKDTYKVGDILKTKDLKIKYISAKKWKSGNKYIKPKAGSVFYRMAFEFENISDSDQSLSTMLGWKCYADDYDCDLHIEEDDFSTELSPGRKSKGAIYFEVPKKAKEIVLEYEDDLFSDGGKIKFIVK